MPKPTQVTRRSGGRPVRRASKTGGSQYLLWIILGAAVLVVVGVIALQTAASAPRTPPMSSRVSAGTSWGPENAPVTVIDYSNFGCSHCKDFAETTGPRLREEYEATGKVRFEFRQFKLNDPSTTDAANASLCAADQNRFWDYHDLLFSKQGLSASAFAKSNLKQYGQQLGLDAAKFNTCVDNSQHMSDVNTQSQEGVRAGVSGTPTFFIDGKMVVGNVSFEEFKQDIDAAIVAKGG